MARKKQPSVAGSAARRASTRQASHKKKIEETLAKLQEMALANPRTAALVALFDE